MIPQAGVPPTKKPAVEGLPEGVDWIKFGAAGPDDFQLVRQHDGSIVISKGPRVGEATGVIVEPSAGYSFRCDIKTLAYFPVKELKEPVTIKAEVVFTVDNEFDQQTVEQELARLKSMPGFVSLINSLA